MEKPEPSENDETVYRLPLRGPQGAVDPLAEVPDMTAAGEQVPQVSSGGHSNDHANVSNSAISQATVSQIVPDEGLDEARTVIRQSPKDGPPKSHRTRQTPADVAGVLVGKQLNQYYLEKLIGGGGMGAVFRAHDTQLDRIVALKVIPFVGRDAELQRRFRNEAQNAARLDHPQIARIFDAGSHDDWHYIVFEYIQGTNLRSHVTSGDVLSLDDAVYITAQIAQALDHASHRGIVHRDIKPSNVLIADDGSVKLVDMGLARSDNLDLSEDMTASGVTLGTFDYISPEQALDPRDADLRSDLYSLGCTMYFMLTGEAPYHGGTMLQKLLSHGNAPLPDPRALRQQLPDEVVSVMHRMMAKDPKARYQNATDLLADLDELAHRFRLTRSRSVGAVAIPQQNEGILRLQSHLPWALAMGLVLLIGGYLELQAVASRDFFEIQRPVSSLVNSGQLQPKPSSNSQFRPSGEDVFKIETAPGDENLSNSASAIGVPSVADLASDSSAAGSTLPENVNQSPTPGEISAEAARPPSLASSLPIPEELRNPDSDVISAGIGVPNTQMEGELTSGGLSGSLSGTSDDVVGPPLSAVDTLGSSALESETTPIELPGPDAIRVVKADQLAEAIKVDQVSRTADGSVLAASLEEAVELAMRFGVLRIELETVTVQCGPLSIPSDEMVFVSTVGRTKVRMMSPKTLSIGRRDMIDLGNNRVQFVNVDFEWALPDQQVDGGSMFVVNDNRFVRFQNCTFTLINELMYDDVVFFRVVTDPESLPDSDTLPGRLFNPNENALPLVAIQFDNSIVRGEAGLIKMDYAAGLQLVWNNGLLAISGQLIDTFGARLRPPVAASPIQISLSNLTARVADGFLRMRLGPTGVFPVKIEREANQCVFTVDEARPHLQIDGLDSFNLQSLITLSGNKNAYEVASTLSDSMLSAQDAEGDTYRVSMSKLRADSLLSTEPEEFAWWNEQSTRWTVYWSTERPLTQMEHRMTVEDFRQDGVVFGGFDESLLPELGRESSN